MHRHQKPEQNLRITHIDRTHTYHVHHSKRGTSQLRRNSSLASLASLDSASLAATVRFIDFEYACVSPVVYDIANHWCVWVAAQRVGVCGEVACACLTCAHTGGACHVPQRIHNASLLCLAQPTLPFCTSMLLRCMLMYRHATTHMHHTHTHTHPQKQNRCEYAADYHTDTPHVLCYERLPDEAAQRAFARVYVRKLVKLWRAHRVRCQA